MNDLLGKLCSAIAKQEGWWITGSRPQRNNNPGDLRAAPWLPGPSIDGGYWKASSAVVGIAGLYHQVALDIARGYSLRKLLNAWAPSSDGNDPDAYIANVKKMTGITDEEAPLDILLELSEPT